MDIHAIIPIRSGSKRFPDKNIHDISGIPLFVFAAHVARESGVFSQVIVTSDSIQYLRKAEAYGYTTHLRSENSSNDGASSEDVVMEVAKDFQFKDEDWVFLIQATNPFQNKQYFMKAVHLIRPEISSIISYRKFKRFFVEDVINGARKRTQEIPYRKLETGLFWGFNVGQFLKKMNRIIQPFELVEVNEYDDVDIDYSEDLQPHIARLESLARQINIQEPGAEYEVN